jgi:hypothetical protein
MGLRTWREEHTDDDDIELKPALQKLVLDLTSDRVKADIRGRTNFFDCWSGHGGLAVKR